jgi:hypothetical protein
MVISFHFCYRCLTISQDVINTADVATLFHLPMLVQAMPEYHQFVHLIHDTQLLQEKDKWIVTTAAPGYSVASAYKTLMQQESVLPAILWLWKSCCQDKHEVFFGFYSRTN